VTTFLDILVEIKDLIKSALPLFDEGYAYCRQDSDKGLVATVGNDREYVGINDTEGDYFYIRTTNISSVPTKSKTDCNVAMSGKMPCSLVAVVKEADEFKLTDAIINILLKTKVIDVRTTWIDPVAIIKEEFKGLSAEVINSANSKIGNRTIVRIDFDLTRNFETHNCTYEICKAC